jgi:hypothetical protein
MKICMLGVLVSGVLGVSVSGIKICGTFCGPTYCDGKVDPECAEVKGAACVASAGNCNETAATDASCADDCCKKHDACCGSPDRRPCNNALVNCLGQCGGAFGDDDAPSCYNGVIPVPVAAIEAAMALNPYGCCGTSCDYTGLIGADGRALAVQQAGGISDLREEPGAVSRG